MAERDINELPSVEEPLTQVVIDLISMADRYLCGCLGPLLLKDGSCKSEATVTNACHSTTPYFHMHTRRITWIYEWPRPKTFHDSLTSSLSPES